MKNRRDLLKGITIGSVWVAPVVSSVILPAHATTTNATVIGTNLEILQQTNGTIELYTDSTYATRIFPGQDVGASYAMVIRTNPVLANAELKIETLIDGGTVNTFNVTTNGDGVAAVEVGQVGGSLLADHTASPKGVTLAGFSLISDARAESYDFIEEIVVTSIVPSLLFLIFRYYI